MHCLLPCSREVEFNLLSCISQLQRRKKIEVRVQYRMGQQVSYFLHSGSALAEEGHGTLAATMGQILKSSRAALRSGKRAKALGPF